MAKIGFYMLIKEEKEGGKEEEDRMGKGWRGGGKRVGEEQRERKKGQRHQGNLQLRSLKYLPSGSLQNKFADA